MRIIGFGADMKTPQGVCCASILNMARQKVRIFLNYANCDMVGHTGVFDAAVAAVEAVDECVGKTVDAVLAKGGIALITADHGNADKMMEDDGSPFTAHTTNLVPLIIAGAGNVLIREGGVLADLSPTMLKLMGLEQPKEMTGKSIIKD